MKFFIAFFGLLAVFALAQAKVVPSEELQEMVEDGRVRVQEYAESVVSKMEADLQRVAEEGFQVPLVSRSCTNDVCRRICNMLGFTKGVCISATSCQCSN